MPQLESQPKTPAETGRRRRFTGVPSQIIRWVTILFAIYTICYISGAFKYVGIFIYPLRHDALFFMFVLSWVYLYFPATRNSPKTRVPWYDIIAIALAVAVNLYIIIFSLDLATKPHRLPTPLEQAFGLITVILILEGVRRTAGLSLTIVGAVFFAYPFVTSYLPSFLEGRNQSLARVMEMMYLFSGGIFGSLLHLLAVLVVMFLLFGAFLQVSGCGKFLVDLAYSAMGRFRGGPAKVSVLASSLFGMINGSGAANVAAVGVVTIPMMKKVGYAPYYAAAIEAVASNGGQIMPPVLGIAAFLMMEFLGVSYTDLIIAAIFPALLYYAALFVMIDLEAVKTGLRGVPPSELPSIRKTLKDGWPYIVPIAILIGLLIARYSPETSCLYSIVALVAISWVRKDLRMGWKKISESLVQGMTTVPDTGVVISMAGILLGVLELTGVGIRMTGGLVEVAGGNMFILLVVTAIAALILGMGMPTSAVYLLVAMLLAPALVKVGMQPLVAHFFVFYYGLAAMLTPPVCLVAFIAAGIAGAPFMKTGWTAMRLGIVIFIVPFMFAYGPQLLLIGNPGEIAIVVITAIIGIFLMSAGIEGYLIREALWPERVILFLAGLLMIAPNLYTSLAGLVLGVIILLWQLRKRRKPPASVQSRPA